MATAKITLIGFQNYLEGYNDDLFKYLSVPTGIDKDLLINNILLRGGEFEVLYSDPVFLQNMIGVWSSKWQRTMERWLNALSIEYNPLENYDRKEDWTDNGSRVSSGNTEETNNRLSASSTNENENRSSSNNTTENRSNATDNTVTEETSRTENAIGNDSSKSIGSGTTTNTRSAFDASTYSPHDKSDTSSEGNNVSSSLTSADGKTEGETVTHNVGSEINSSDSSQTEDGTHSSNSSLVDNIANSSKMNNEDKTASLHSGRIRGNIGVTTSQQMLQAELDIDKWNLYEEITDLFLNEFCIYLY